MVCDPWFARLPLGVIVLGGFFVVFLDEVAAPLNPKAFCNCAAFARDAL